MADDTAYMGTDPTSAWSVSGFVGLNYTALPDTLPSSWVVYKTNDTFVQIFWKGELL